MQAWTRTGYGGPEVVRLAEVPDPVAGAGELLVRVHATTVNRTDAAYRSGRPWVNKAFCGWPRPAARCRILGSEYAGVVEAVGSDVSRFAVGDRVFGFVDGRPGAHAELVAVPADGLVATIPDGWSFADAAPGMEGAHYALAFPRVAGTRPGDRVLVHGATGAIGSALVQILVADGVEVTAVVDQPLPRELGASYDVVGPVRRGLRRRRQELLSAPTATSSTKRGSYASSELGRGGQNVWLALVSRRVHFPLPKGERRGRGPDPRPDGERRLPARWSTGPTPSTSSAEAYAYVDTGRKVGNIVLTMTMLAGSPGTSGLLPARPVHRTAGSIS